MRRVLSLAVLTILAFSASANAQRTTMTKPSPEIGIDAGVSFGLGDLGTTTTSLPAQHVRMGFALSPIISIEPTLGLVSTSTGGATSTDYSIGAGLLYHFSPSRAANQFYVRPFLNIDGTSGGPVSGSNAVFGVGGGFKMPLRDRFASRFEVNFAHADAGDAIGLLAGLSFYTR